MPNGLASRTCSAPPASGCSRSRPRLEVPHPPPSVGGGGVLSDVVVAARSSASLSPTIVGTPRPAPPRSSPLTPRARAPPVDRALVEAALRWTRSSRARHRHGKRRRGACPQQERPICLVAGRISMSALELACPPAPNCVALGPAGSLAGTRTAVGGCVLVRRDLCTPPTCEPIGPGSLRDPASLARPRPVRWPTACCDPRSARACRQRGIGPPGGAGGGRLVRLPPVLD